MAAAAGGVPPIGAAAHPGLPAPPALPSSLAEWFGNNANPCASSAQLLHPFRDEPNLVETIYTSLTTTTYPLPLLVNGEDGSPHVILMPFNENTLPGQPVGRKFALVGDVTTQGAVPPLIIVPRPWFQLTTYQDVHATANYAALLRRSTTSSQRHRLYWNRGIDR